jgi:catechol 2,3-dioxygenase-like lactoylglutathione lyase family enzyme
MTIMERKSFVGAEQREAVPQNKFGLSGVDHFGIPTRDPDLAGKFIEQILGGIECYRAGYSEQDRKMGRLRHIFYHVGAQLVEVVEQDDGVSYPDKTNPGAVNTNPHWAFGTTAEGVANFVKHLEREGIPYDGPRSHRGASVVSVYFRDLDGNNLEVTTWKPIPEGLMETKQMGGEYGFISWKDLTHQWRPR